jgi:hypothetical protein
VLGVFTAASTAAEAAELAENGVGGDVVVGVVGQGAPKVGGGSTGNDVEQMRRAEASWALANAQHTFEDIDGVLVPATLDLLIKALTALPPAAPAVDNGSGGSSTSSTCSGGSSSAQEGNNAAAAVAVSLNEALVFFLKIKGEYCRHAAEVADTGSAAQAGMVDTAQRSFEEAERLCCPRPPAADSACAVHEDKELEEQEQEQGLGAASPARSPLELFQPPAGLPPCNLMRLGLVFSHTLFLSDVKADLESACTVARTVGTPDSAGPAVAGARGMFNISIQGQQQQQKQTPDGSLPTGKQTGGEEPEEDEPPPAPTESESAGMVLDMIIRNAVDWAALLDILDSLSTQTADVGTGKVAGGPRADEN